MMRIALAGTGTLTRHLAHYLSDSVHPFIILSRAEDPQLEELGYQIVPVDYDSQESLRFALRGIDVVISTIPGTPQINLIDAAAHSRVRCFVPSEFEGLPSRRSNPDDLDRGRERAGALDRLKDYAERRHRHHMKYTVFACGAFYERFARGGLAARGIATWTGPDAAQGSFLVNLGTHEAHICEKDRGTDIFVCLTSVDDLARYIVAALDLGLDQWPQEFKVRGERLTLAQVVQWCEAVKGGQGGSLIYPSIYNVSHLPAHLGYAIANRDDQAISRFQTLIAVANRRYDFSSVSSQTRQLNVQPVGFWDWLVAEWGTGSG